MRDKEDKSPAFLKSVILDILDYLRNRVYNDECTLSELNSAHEVLTHLDITGTSDDLAKHFGKSPSNIKSVTSKIPNKPIARKQYRLNIFRKYMPKSWAKA